MSVGNMIALFIGGIWNCSHNFLPFNLHVPDLVDMLLQIAHLSAMEVNVVRPFVVRTLQAFYKHDNPVVMEDLDSISDRQPQGRQPQVPNNARRVSSCSLTWFLYLFTQKTLFFF